MVKFRLTNSGISSTLHTVVRYEHRSLGGIGLFEPLIIQGTDRIVFLTEHYCKSILSIAPPRDNLATLKLVEGRGGRILENDYIETK